MLLDPQGNKLGDKRVENAEGVARLKEKVRGMVDKKRIANQDMLEDQDMALGSPMSPSLFIQKLRKLPNVIVEPGGWPNAVAVRTVVRDDDADSPTYGQQVKKYISGFVTDRVLPEFSSILTDHMGLATREIRGWRTVLLALFNQKVVTLQQLKAVFGDANGQRSKLWHEQTQASKV